MTVCVTVTEEITIYQSKWELFGISEDWSRCSQRREDELTFDIPFSLSFLCFKESENRVLIFSEVR